jgi:hypothetical protein
MAFIIGWSANFSKLTRLSSDKPFNPVKGKLIQLVGTLLVLIFNGVSAFRYVEVTFGNQDLSIVDTL